MFSLAWADPTALNGKPFEYLESLSQSSNTPVSVYDSVNNEVGTFLGLGKNNTRVLLGLTGAVDGQEFSFVVAAEKNGFDASAQVDIVYPWIEDINYTDLVSVCGPYAYTWNHHWGRDTACGQALVTYIINTSPCDQPEKLAIRAQGDTYSIGGFFEAVLIGEPGATVYKTGAYIDYTPPNTISSYTSMVGIDENGSCGVIYVKSQYTYPYNVRLYSFDKLGDLYDTYSPPFRMVVQ